MAKKPKISVSKSSFHRAFNDVFVRLAERYGRYHVWHDFVVMTACSLSNSCDKRFWDAREEMYTSAVNRYDKVDLNKFVELLSITTAALTDNPEQDFLGEIFSSLNLHNEWRGQFFTPYHIGSLMATINAENLPSEVAEKGSVTVSDCCCGAGCLLIAYANTARKAGVNFQRDILFFAQDMDFVAAMMCYIQLSLLGCKAIVKVGDSLTDPFVTEDVQKDCTWLTPMYAAENTINFMRLVCALEE